MENNNLVAETDLKRDEENRRKLQSARIAHEQASEIQARLQSRCEDARARLLGARDCPGTPQERKDALEKECLRLEKERDEENAAVERRLKQARGAASEFLWKFISAYSGWLDAIRQAHSFDRKLDTFILESRRQLDRMGKELAPLSKVRDFFEEKRRIVEAWTFPPESEEWTTSGQHKRELVLPRLADFFRG